MAFEYDSRVVKGYPLPSSRSPPVEVRPTLRRRLERFLERRVESAGAGAPRNNPSVLAECPSLRFPLARSMFSPRSLIHPI